MGIIIRQSLKATIVNYVGAFIGFITMMFVSTKFLTPEELGLKRVMIEAATILGGLMALGIGSSGVRFFPFFKTDKNSHNNGFLFYLLLFPVTGAIAFGLLYVFFKTGITNYFAAESPLFNQFFYYIIPLAILMAFTTVFETYAMNLMRIVIPRFIREVLLRLMSIAVILLYFFEFFTLPQFILALISTYGIMMILNGIYIAMMGKFSLKHDFSYIETPLKKEVASYTGFVVLASLGSAFSLMAGMFMLGGMKGLEYAGIYSIATFMAVIVEIPNRQLQAISSPVAAQAIKENDKSKAQELFRKVSLNQLLMSSLVFVFLWINIDTIFYYIPNSEVFSRGKYVVLFVGIARIFFMIASFANTLVTYSKYYYYILFFMTFLLISTIGLNLTLIPIYALSGAALATTITYIVYCFLMLAFVKWKLNMHPFSIGMLKILVIVAGLFLLNFLLPTLGSPLVDSLYRSFILAVIAGCSVYFWTVSEDMNSLIKSFFCRDKISSL